jgi:alkanesulfonate monooxygenase SsuD/methylene tetrahydromethanopterin reductase-like flavin-dependent oxidoreductase (luciferase family)
MRIGAILSPITDVSDALHAAQAADRHGLDAVGLWDHYHSPRPEWGYVAGWTALGAIAAVTDRIRIVPSVLNNLHYQIGVLAKESAVLALASGGRFELGIGAGDWPGSFTPWGEVFPPRDERLGRLADTIVGLRALWQGDPVTLDGRWVRLAEAISTPAPASAPRVVLGVGGSRATLDAVGDLADELNVYAGPGLIEAARAREPRADGGRGAASVSVFLSWEWDKWPGDPATELAALADRGAHRALVSLGATRDEMVRRIERLAEIGNELAGRAGEGRTPDDG